MTINELIARINIREQYNAAGYGELQCSDEELNAQLTNCVNTAIDNLLAQKGDAKYNVAIDAKGNITVSIGVHANIVAVNTAVIEFLVNEVAYLWWMDNMPQHADASARALLAHRVKELSSDPKVAPAKRVNEMEFIPEGRYTIK